MQLIYKGNIDRCHPRGVKFPAMALTFTHTPNHRSNEDKTVELLQEVVFAFVKNIREKLRLPLRQKAVAIFSCSANTC